LTQEGQRTKDLRDSVGIVFATIRQRFEVGVEFPEEPTQLDIPLCFLLQTATGADTMHVAIDVKCEEVSRRGGGTASGGRLRVSKAEGVEVQTVGKGVDETRRILLGNIVIKSLRKEHLLDT
jgi:hypothetical protein